MLIQPKPSAFASNTLIQQSLLRQVLKNANAPQDTADQAAQQNTLAVLGYVAKVETVQGFPTLVYVSGQDWMMQVPQAVVLAFPPNDPMYLAELLRAMNHPHFRVLCAVTYTGNDPGQDAVIAYLGVLTDYDQIPLAYGQVNFDLREIKNTTNNAGG